jgi:hypothetical protein
MRKREHIRMGPMVTSTMAMGFWNNNRSIPLLILSLVSIIISIMSSLPILLIFLLLWTVLVAVALVVSVVRV